MKAILILSSFFISFMALAQTLVTPTRALNEAISFTDDLELKNLETAIERQLAAFRRSAPKGEIKFGTRTYPARVLVDSMLLFQAIVEEAILCRDTAAADVCMARFSQRLNAEFDKYVPVPAPTDPNRTPVNTTLFTAYYSPDVSASRTQTARFKNPIYALPQTEELRRKTREEIDFEGALAGKGLELFYVEDSLYDIWILHVEGGGRALIHKDDGTVEKIYLSYAGANGQRFEFLSKYMIAQGMLPANRATIDNQRRYIDENPERAREIFASSPSYVYFKETTSEPLGVRSIPLTEGRSLAIDTRIYKEVGMINFVVTEKPYRTDDGRVLFEGFSRFFISQDTGGAIRGNARCDLYMGYGPEAALAAQSINRVGRQIFLVKK